MLGNWSVYKHTLPDGKVYVGITSLPPEERWENGFGYKDQRRFFRHIVRVGWDNISHEIVAEGLTEKTARLLERELIQEAKKNSLNVQHRTEEEDRWAWIHRPIIDDEMCDRKVKFRGMNDDWMDKVHYKDTPPFDWEIMDDYIDFKYATDYDGICYDTLRVSIPHGVTYGGLYHYLYWKADITTAELVESVRFVSYVKYK